MQSEIKAANQSFQQEQMKLLRESKVLQAELAQKEAALDSMSETQMKTAMVMLPAALPARLPRLPFRSRFFGHCQLELGPARIGNQPQNVFGRYGGVVPAGRWCHLQACGRGNTVKPSKKRIKSSGKSNCARKTSCSTSSRHWWPKN